MSEPMSTIPTQSPFTYPNPNPSASPSFTQDDTFMPNPSASPSFTQDDTFMPEPIQPMPTFTQTAFSQPAVHTQHTQPTQTNPTGQQYPNNVQSQQFQQFQTATVSANNAKFPYLEKEKYEIWAMKMEYWIQNADHNLWRIVQQGNSPKRLGKDAKGNTIVHPPVSLDEHVAIQRENKVRTLLLQALPEDHMPDFHHYDDARDIWMAVKARFGGNEESKKMKKTMLKQQFAEFSVTEEEGLHKGYDRFQKILSQLNQVQARPDNDDINLKFLRALPSSWSQVALALKTRGGLESMSFDDLYNKLRSLELDVRIGHSYGVKVAAAPTHSAFIGTACSGSKPTYSDQQRIVPSVSQTSGRSDNVMECVLHSFVAENEQDQDMIYEDFDQVDQLEMEELDLKWQMAMLSLRINRFEKKAGRKMNYNNQQPARFDRRKVTEVKTDEPKALVSVDSMVNWSDHAAENKTGEVEKVYGMMAGLHADNGGADVQRLELILWKESSKNLEKLINSSMSTRTKIGLGFKEYFGKDEVFDLSTPSVMYPEPVEEVKPLSSWFVKLGDTWQVPPSITRHKCPPHTMTILQTQRPTSCVQAQDKDPRLPTFYKLSADGLNPAARPYSDHHLIFNKCMAELYDPKNKDPMGYCLVILVKGGIVKFGGGDGRISGKGTIRTSKLDFENVYYVEELQHFNLIPRNGILLNFNISNYNQNKMLLCLVAKDNPWMNPPDATEGWLINKGKQHKASYKHIFAVRLITETLQLLHMDLFGPTNIRSIDQKYYSLVVTDDFTVNLDFYLVLHRAMVLVLWNAMQIMQKSLLSFKDKNMKLRTQLHDMVFLFSQETTEIISQAEAEIRNHGVSADRDPAGIDSAGGVSAGSTSAGNDPAGDTPAGSFEPADKSNPAVSSSVSADFNPVYADESTLPPGQSLGSSANTTRFPLLSDVCMDQLSSGIFTSSSYDDDFSAKPYQFSTCCDVIKFIQERRDAIIHQPASMETVPFYLLVVIISAGCFISAGSYGLCCWFRVHAEGHTSAGGFISADGVCVHAVCMFLLLFDFFCWLNTFMLLALFVLLLHLFMLLNWFVLFDIAGWLVSATGHLVSAGSIQSCW
ncbi:hypothetical protein Tco_0163258 [Tanacetum coccineum]